MQLLGLFSLPDWLVYLSVFLITAYVYYTWNFNVLKQLGIPGPKPYPVLGNLLLFAKSMYNFDLTLIRTYGKVVGNYFGRDPVIVIGDIAILRQILIKEFPTFVNRMEVPMRGIFKKTVFDARDDDWRHLRRILTPTFTTGRLKQMTPLVNRCADQLVANLAEAHEKNEAFEAKEYTGYFTMDLIAATAFGLDLNSQKDKDNRFVVQAQKFFQFSLTQPLVIVFFFLPFLNKLLDKLGVVALPKSCLDFFSEISSQAIEQRRNQPQTRVDLLQLLMDAEKLMEEEDAEVEAVINHEVGMGWKDNKKGLTKEEIIAQCLIFFLAGYETTATTATFLMYNLATKPDIQDKVLEEMDSVMEGHDETSYDLVSKMTYLDMCIQESLRMYPPVGRIDRCAEKTVEINGMTIPEKMPVIIPIRAVMMDPQVWPDPEKFDPQRFTPEAKSTRDPLCHIPFGAGPRTCIGMRLAMLELKVAFTKILRRFRLVTCDKTQVPVKLTSSFFPNPEKGIWLKLEERRK